MKCFFLGVCHPLEGSVELQFSKREQSSQQVTLMLMKDPKYLNSPSVLSARYSTRIGIVLRSSICTENKKY